MSAVIKKTCVIGAGQMGAQIAAQMANAGLEVLLLDVEKARADQALNLLKKAKPCAFMHPSFVKRITIGSSQQDLNHIQDCDWILEAVLEDKPLKQRLYAEIEQVRKENALISTNTSTLRRADLVEGMSARFKRDFFITHFFNPPRYMRLLELVGGSECDLEKQQALIDCCDFKLGKTVIRCQDTPGFLANRLGIFWLYTALQKTLESGLSIEEADRLLSKPFGIPKTGVFGLMDLVGIDLMPFVTQSMVHSLAPSDPFVRAYQPIPLILEMIKSGYTGRKGHGGFYRRHDKIKQVRDLKSGTYHACDKRKKEKSSAQTLMADNGFVRDVMGETFRYACHMVGDATEHLDDIDTAMKLGYNWKKGPFELMDEIGWSPDQIDGSDNPLSPILNVKKQRSFYEKGKSLRLEGHYHAPAHQENHLNLQEIKHHQRPLLSNDSARLWEIADAVVCFEFCSTMNMIDHNTLALMEKTIALCTQDHKALVLYNEGENFSIGANLGLALFQANIAAFDDIHTMVISGQKIMQALKYAPFPVIGAPHGMALGGGCEFLLHADHIVAHSESYVGLVETGVGLIPAWGGCKEMLARWQGLEHFAKGPLPAAQKTFETLGLALVSTSAHDAIHKGFFHKDTTVVMNRDHLLYEACQKALELIKTYRAPQPPTYHLAGPSGKAAFDLAVSALRDQAKATPHDQTVMSHLGAVLSGGPLGDLTRAQSEDDILDLEQAHFMELVQHPATLARIEHMVLTHKPLRN